MGHTLTITNGSTVIDLALSSGTGGAFLGDDGGNSGYRPGTPAPDVSYTASLYRDGQKPTFSRYQNVVDEIDVTISEATVDALYVTIGNIKKALWDARDYFEYPLGWRDPVYISFKPSGSTNTAYSVVFSGTVDEEIMDNVSLNNKLMRVRIRLEREPFWRAYIPYRIDASFGSSGRITGDLGGPPATPNAKPWGNLVVPVVGGHIPALGRIAFSPKQTGGPTIDKVVMAYRSRYSGPHTLKYPHTPLELETWTLGTNCTATADATASPGGAGNTRVTCTFATKTDAKRAGTTFNTGYFFGKYRVFLRYKCNAANTITAYIKTYLSNDETAFLSTAQTTTSVSGSATTYTMLDMGIVAFDTQTNITIYPGPPTPPGQALMNVELWASASSTVDTYFDFLLFVPCDEYYMTLTGMNSTDDKNQFYVSTIEATSLQAPMSMYFHSYTKPTDNYASRTAVGTGTIYLPAGAGTLIWLTGDSNWGNTFTSSDNCVLQFWKSERYLTARGSG